MNSLPHGYQPLGAKLTGTRNGALIAFESGTTTPYALQTAEARGELLCWPRHRSLSWYDCRPEPPSRRYGNECLQGRTPDEYALQRSDGVVQLTPFIELSLEQCIDFLNDDELLEVTPKSLRLRKRYLDSNERKRAAKSLKKNPRR